MRAAGPPFSPPEVNSRDLIRRWLISEVCARFVAREMNGSAEVGTQGSFERVRERVDREIKREGRRANEKEREREIEREFLVTGKIRLAGADSSLCFVLSAGRVTPEP